VVSSIRFCCLFAGPLLHPLLQSGPGQG
jgi:hypothetical protein